MTCGVAAATHGVPAEVPGGVMGLDGHDGAGKTTLAARMATHLGGRPVRPFAGASGQDLLAAYHAGDHERVIAIGKAAIGQAVGSAAAGRPVVLDRSWLTVASLVPESVFAARWTLWVPTVLCWCDLPTTLARLGRRTHEPTAEPSWHEHFLTKYRELAEARSVPLVRTDDGDVATTLDRLIATVCRPAGSDP